MSELTGFSMRAPNKEKASGFGRMVELGTPITWGTNPNGTIIFKGKCPETGNTVCTIKGAKDGKAIVDKEGYKTYQ